MVSGLSHSHPGLPAEAWGESVFHIVCLLFNVASLRARALSLIPPPPPPEANAWDGSGDIVCSNNQV